jgi:hypothetical protein
MSEISYSEIFSISDIDILFGNLSTARENAGPAAHREASQIGETIFRQFERQSSAVLSAPKWARF